MTEGTNDWSGMVAEIALSRKTLKAIDETKKAAKKKLEALPESIALGEWSTKYKEQEQKVDQMVEIFKNKFVEFWKGTEPAKRPEFHGVEVKNFEVLTYDKVEAAKWIREMMPAFLVIDWDSFNDFARKNPSKIPCVKVVKEPRVQLASDLSEYIE